MEIIRNQLPVKPIVQTKALVSVQGSERITLCCCSGKCCEVISNLLAQKNSKKKKSKLVEEAYTTFPGEYKNQYQNTVSEKLSEITFQL